MKKQTVFLRNFTYRSLMTFDLKQTHVKPRWDNGFKWQIIMIFPEFLAEKACFCSWCNGFLEDDHVEREGKEGKVWEKREDKMAKLSSRIVLRKIFHFLFSHFLLFSHFPQVPNRGGKLKKGLLLVNFNFCVVFFGWSLMDCQHHLAHLSVEVLLLVSLRRRRWCCLCNVYAC